MKEKFIQWCQDNKVLITESKPINYGHQFKLSKGADKLSLSLFNTGKQLAQGKDSELKSSVEKFFGITKTANTKSDKSTSPSLQHDKKVWIGVDESGKGDFFGPLVVSAVVVHKDLEDQLLSLGVKDSKKLNDHRVREMAPQLMNKLKHHSVILMPEEYNEVYDTLKT
jgi:ribonuclease HIII